MHPIAMTAENETRQRTCCKWVLVTNKLATTPAVPDQRSAMHENSTNVYFTAASFIADQHDAVTLTWSFELRAHRHLLTSEPVARCVEPGAMRTRIRSKLVFPWMCFSCEASRTTWSRDTGLTPVRSRRTRHDRHSVMAMCRLRSSGTTSGRQSRAPIKQPRRLQAWIF